MNETLWKSLTIGKFLVFLIDRLVRCMGLNVNKGHARWTIGVGRVGSSNETQPKVALQTASFWAAGCAIGSCWAAQGQCRSQFDQAFMLLALKYRCWIDRFF